MELDNKEPIAPRKVVFENESRLSYDKLWLGLVCGVMAPLITLYIYYEINFGHLTFSEFIHGSFMLNVSSAVLSLCLLSNLLVFFLFIWTERNESARGVLMATFFYAIPVIYLKFFA